MALPIPEIRAQFPILKRQIHGRPLVYLDSAATTQKPAAVISAITDYYQNHNANVHRGVHTLGDESTQIYLSARERIAHFFGATSENLILTRNTTEASNLLSVSLSAWVGQGDLAVSLLEHHSNFVPWQRLAQRQGGAFLVLPLDEQGQLAQEQAQELLFAHKDTLRGISLVHLSNALGTKLPIATISGWLEEWGVRERVVVIADVSQSAAHEAVSLELLGADVLLFSGHKLYGPQGTGGMIVHPRLLPFLEPVLWGGGMIEEVGLETTTAAQETVDRFTAGTPDVAGATGLAAALDWLSQYQWHDIQDHEYTLVRACLEGLRQVPGFSIVGPPAYSEKGEVQRFASVAFLHHSIHAHDIAQVLDRDGIAVRSGHHCTMPLHTHFAWQATTRASFAIYNTLEEVEIFLHSLKKVEAAFGV